MNSLSFTVQDIIGALLGCLLFPLIMVTPGYVIGLVFDLFNFKSRLLLVRILISIVLSISVCPILIYLSYRLVGSWAAWLILFTFLAGFIGLILTGWVRRDTRKQIIGDEKTKRYQLWALLLGASWAAFCIFCLVDIQLGNRLYYTVIGLDYTTRAALIDAITRTGVPPINPSYYPGQPEPLTYLYYFWYILGSLVDQAGGKWVDSRAALIASVCWCGLGLMATIALYLRLRNPSGGPKAWRSAFLGIGFLLVSGLDIIPVTFYMILARFQIGVIGLIDDIEHWNDQITAWVGAVQWVPNHVASLIACLTGMMLIQSIAPDKLLAPEIEPDRDSRISVCFGAGIVGMDHPVVRGVLGRLDAGEILRREKPATDWAHGAGGCYRVAGFCTIHHRFETRRARRTFIGCAALVIRREAISTCHGVYQ